MCETSVDDFRRVIDVDLNGPFIVSKAVIPGMIKKGGGKIINICSMMSELGRETVSAYAAAKGGTEDADTQHRFGIWCVQHSVQRNRTGLYRDLTDGSTSGTSGGRQPSAFRCIHHL
jgi:hypothetical protein